MRNERRMSYSNIVKRGIIRLFEYYRKKSRNLFEYRGSHPRRKKISPNFLSQKNCKLLQTLQIVRILRKKEGCNSRKTILIILKEGELQTGTKYCLNFSSFRVTEALFEYNEWQNHKRKLATHIRQCMISKHCIILNH